MKNACWLWGVGIALALTAGCGDVSVKERPPVAAPPASTEQPPDPPSVEFCLDRSPDAFVAAPKHFDRSVFARQLAREARRGRRGCC
jgi:hypothetical protein